MKPAIVMAAKVALDMKVFPVLADLDSPVPLAKLAAAKPADPLLVGQSTRSTRSIVCYNTLIIIYRAYSACFSRK